jgi:hypothetical protein
MVRFSDARQRPSRSSTRQRMAGGARADCCLRGGGAVSTCAAARRPQRASDGGRRAIGGVARRRESRCVRARARGERQDHRQIGVPAPTPGDRSPDRCSTRGTSSPVDASSSERVPSERERTTSRLAQPPIWSDTPYHVPFGARPCTSRRTSPMETRSPSSITNTSEIPPPGQSSWLPALKNRRTTEGSPTSGSWALMETGSGDLERLELVVVVLVLVGHGVTVPAAAAQDYRQRHKTAQLSLRLSHGGTSGRAARPARGCREGRAAGVRRRAIGARAAAASVETQQPSARCCLPCSATLRRSLGNASDALLLRARGSSPSYLS